MRAALRALAAFRLARFSLMFTFHRVVSSTRQLQGQQENGVKS